MFRPLTGIFEPSAIQQLADGRFIVVEDEKDKPFTILTIDGYGNVGAEALIPADDATAACLGTLADLEGLTADAHGYVYAVTSHSRSGKGEEKKSREKLVRFRVEGSRIAAASVVGNLKAALTAAHSVLATAAAVIDVKQQGGLNIEAIEMAPDGGRLFIGFRGPLVQGRAILATLDNPALAFAEAGEVRIGADLIALDLGGHGLRSMAWIEALGGYVLVGGPVGRDETPFRLWFWAGPGHDAARPAAVPDLPDFAHTEGVAAAVIAGRGGLILVSDDGDRESGRAATFAWLEPGQIRIA